MQRISNLSIAVMYVMYFLAALFGYLTFYGTAALRAEAGAGLGGARRLPLPTGSGRTRAPAAALARAAC